MSSLIMYTIHKDGSAKEHCLFKNSFRGAMLIWQWLAQRYIPGKPFFNFLINQEDRSLWELAYDKNVKESHRIVFANTFDNVLVRRENFPRLIAAMQEFAQDCYDPGHLPVQIEMLKTLVDNEDILAVGWNQTSVTQSLWEGQYDEDDNPIPFNLNTDTKHWFLFEDTKLGFQTEVQAG